MDYFNKSNWSQGWGLRFNIGLTISLALTLVAFEWKSDENNAIGCTNFLSSQEEEMISVPQLFCPPPPIITEIPKEKAFDNLSFSYDLKVVFGIDKAVFPPFFSN